MRVMEFSTRAWLDAWSKRGSRAAIQREAGCCTYRALAGAFERASEALDDHALAPGSVVSVPLGYSIRSAALLLALAERRCIAVPIGDRVTVDEEARRRKATGASWITVWDAAGGWGFDRDARVSETPELIQQLQRARRPGIVLFTSGTTGEPKAAVHDLGLFLGRYVISDRPGVRILPLLFADHVGGIDVYWRALASGATLVRPPDLAPETIARTVKAQGVEVIVASPSQLGFLHAAGVLEARRFGEVRRIVHGAESMPPALQERLRAALPQVQLEQRFGTTETGALRIQPRGPGSAWFALDETISWQVREGELWIRTPGRALGYLHGDADGRFLADGWFRTGDLVDVEDDRWLRIRGRITHVINVGGAKVVPEEVEAVLMEIPNIVECVVTAESHALAGQVVVAELDWRGGETLSQVLGHVRRHCRGRLSPAAVPVKVRLRPAATTAALKKQRGGVSHNLS